MQPNNQIIKTVRSHVIWHIVEPVQFMVVWQRYVNSLRQMGWAFPVMSVRTMTKNCVFACVAIAWEESSRVLFPDDSVFTGITGIAKPLINSLLEWDVYTLLVA